MELQLNPFYILQATPRDDKRRLAELAEEASLTTDPDACQKARTELTNPRKRLAAEIAWFPGVSPAKAKELLAHIEGDASGLLDIQLDGGLVRFNVLTAALANLPGLKSSILAQWVFDIGRSFDEIDIDALCLAINADRSVAGFPSVTDTAWVESEINVRRNIGKKVIGQALDLLATADRIAALTFIIESATREGNQHAPVLIHDLIDDYELESKADLEKGEAEIKALVESVKKQAAAGASDESLSAMIEQLLSELESWDKAAQPIQVSKKSLGQDHNASQRVARIVRVLAIDLYNDHNQLVIAQRITANLQTLFAELLDVSEITEADAITLKNLEQNQARERLYSGLEKINGAPSLRTINGFGLKLYGSTDPDPENGSYLSTYYFTAFFIPIFPICRYRVIRNGNSYSFLGKAPLRKFDKWHLGIAVAIIVAFGVNAMSGNTSSVPEAPIEEPRQEAPAAAPIEEPISAPVPQPIESPSPEAPSAADPTYFPGQQNTYSTPINTGLKDEIEQGQAELESMESGLKNLKQTLESYRSSLETYKAEGNYDSYNALVDDYNTTLESFQSQYRKYKQQLDEVNAKISRYNAGER
jgi:hypothetical protein